MTGTFGRALEVRGIQAGEGRLLAEATGEVELDGTVLVLRRIHVHYRLTAGPEAREAAERVLGVHVNHCPVARSIGSSIAISASLTLEEG